MVYSAVKRGAIIYASVVQTEGRQTLAEANSATYKGDMSEFVNREILGSDLGKVGTKIFKSRHGQHAYVTTYREGITSISMTDDSQAASKALAFNALIKKHYVSGGAEAVFKIIVAEVKANESQTQSLHLQEENRKTMEYRHQSASSHGMDVSSLEHREYGLNTELQVGQQLGIGMDHVDPHKPAGHSHILHRDDMRLFDHTVVSETTATQSYANLGTTSRTTLPTSHIPALNKHSIRIEEAEAEEIHLYDNQTTEEVELPDKIEETYEEEVEEFFTQEHEVREMVQYVEDVIEVPRIKHEERVTEKEVPNVRKIQRMVEVPTYETRITQKPVIRTVEEVVEIPKVKIVEDRIERSIPQIETVFKTVEVPEVHERVIMKPVEVIVERIVPKTITKFVDKPVVIYRDVEKVVPRERRREIMEPVYTYVENIVEIPVVTEEVTHKYVEKVEIVEEITHKYVEKIQEEIVEMPIVKTVTKDVRREIPIDKKIVKNIDVPVIQENVIEREYEVVEEEVIEVPKVIQVHRNKNVEIEQEIEIPVYVSKVKNIYHHQGTSKKQKQKTVQKKTKHVLEKHVEQKQIDIKKKVIHRPKYVEVDQVQWVDVVREILVDKVEEEIIEVPQVIYKDIEEPVECIRKKYRYVEVERVEKVPKYVDVPVPEIKETLIHVPKIQYTDVFVDQEVIRHVEVPHIVENIVERPVVTYKERVVERYVDTWVDVKVPTNIVVRVNKYVEKPVTRRKEKIVEIPKVVVVKKTVEVPQIRVVKKYVEVVKTEEKINYIDVEVENIVEEVVEVPVVKYIDIYKDVPKVRRTTKHVEVPQIEYIDREIEVPKIKKVEKMVEIPREVHFDVSEHSIEMIDMGVTCEEETTRDKITVRGDDLEPVVVAEEHVWDTTTVPVRYKDIALPDFGDLKAAAPETATSEPEAPEPTVDEQM
jgi:hypothetical protein